VGRHCIPLLRVYASQTNDPAGHPADITLAWAECNGSSCNVEAAKLQPVINCAGDTKASRSGDTRGDD